MDDMTPGDVVVVHRQPLVRRVLAPNPGVMTGPGTNTYLVGRGDVAVIDPGPDDEGHLASVTGAAEAGAGRIRWILVTHTHPDHAPGAARLRAMAGGDAAVLGFGPRDGFVPDRAVGEGFALDGGDFRLRALHTPGHTSDHLCYLLEGEDLLFSGDHVMAGSTVLIAPPDGDMAAYLDALRRLQGLGLRAIAPGHGPVLDDPAATLEGYVRHRLAREEAVAAALAAAGPGDGDGAGDGATLDDLLPTAYADVPAALHPIARLSLWAHLRKLAADGRAAADDPDDPAARWHAVPRKHRGRA